MKNRTKNRMKNRTKNRMKNTTKNKQRRQKIKSRKNNMKRNAKRTLRRGGYTGNPFDSPKTGNPFDTPKTGNPFDTPKTDTPKTGNPFDPIPIISNIKSNNKTGFYDAIAFSPPPPSQPPSQHLPSTPLPRQKENLLQPQPQSQQPLQVKTKDKNGRLYVPPPSPYQLPPAPPQLKQQTLVAIGKQQRQLILKRILDKIDYSFKLIKHYLNEINNELIDLDYRSDAKVIKNSLELDLSSMITNIKTQIIPSRTYHINFTFIFNTSYREIYNYAIRNIMDIIKLINNEKKSNEKKSYFVFLKRNKDKDKDKNKKLEEIVKMFEKIKEEYTKIYNNVSKLVV
jgi:hypothetical protein